MEFTNLQQQNEGIEKMIKNGERDALILTQETKKNMTNLQSQTNRYTILQTTAKISE